MYKNRRKFLQIGGLSLITASSNASLLVSKKINTKNDLFIAKKDYEVFQSVRNKLKLIQRYVGYGNFNILSFDSMLSIGKRAANIKDFTKEELDELHKLSMQDHIYPYEPINPSVLQLNGKLQKLAPEIESIVLRTQTASNLSDLIPSACDLFSTGAA